MIGYQVNNKVFFNTYLAQYESFKSKQAITFHCNDLEYDLLDWTTEPEASMEELMDIHARNLREKYERLVFMWSGGTDSHTIYNVFKRNNIHVDEIIIKHSTDIEPYPDSHVDWLMKNHYDPTTVITPINEYDTELRSIVIQNEDWIFDNSGDLLKYGQSALSKATQFLCEKNHAGHNWCVVVGLEKPSLHFENNRWYTRQSDMVIRQACGFERAECFFLEPVINLKQSHLAKRALKQLHKAGKDLNWSTQFYFNGELGYRAWARIVGRHDELTLGISHTQKQINSKINHTILSPDQVEYDQVHGEMMLLAKLKQNDTTAINYVKGLRNLAHERDFYNHLNENCFISPNQILRPKEIWSKSYDLGE